MKFPFALIAIICTLYVSSSAKMVNSCRPTCIAFQLDRSAVDCHRSGAFEFDPSPWDLASFRASPCEALGSNATGLPQDLTLWVHESRGYGQIISSRIDIGTDDVFTYCSDYECPFTECEIPDQMGSTLQIDIHAAAVHGAAETPIMSLILGLTIDFVGNPFEMVGSTRFGPLVPLWMDDPFDCRPGLFTEDDMQYPADDDDFVQEKAPLTNIFDRSNEQDVVESQLCALRSLFLATHMNSSASLLHHDWFSDGDQYCSFKGIGCDQDKYVITLNLNGTGLAGSLPSSISGLQKLKRLRLSNNQIAGTLPTTLTGLSSLRMLNIEENKFSGQLPIDIGRLTKLRRFLVQSNQFDGTLPEGLCQLEHLTALDLSDNADIVGTLPSCLGELQSLSLFHIRNLDLTGSVPSQLCGLRPFHDLLANTFGCDALACPSGTFLLGEGRQSIVESPCVPCSKTSNVIGGTSCRFVEDNMQRLWSVPTESSSKSRRSMATVQESQQGSTASSPVFPSENPTLSMPQSSMPLLKDSNHPSSSPSTFPSEKPSKRPLMFPSSTPSLEGSEEPSSIPSMFSSEKPSKRTSMFPSSTPSLAESKEPSNPPSTEVPSEMPSAAPIESPSNLPSATPSYAPVTASPNMVPSSKPSSVSSFQPSTIWVATQTKPRTDLKVSPTPSPTYFIFAFDRLERNAPAADQSGLRNGIIVFVVGLVAFLASVAALVGHIVQKSRLQGSRRTRERGPEASGPGEEASRPSDIKSRRLGIAPNDIASVPARTESRGISNYPVLTLYKHAKDDNEHYPDDEPRFIFLADFDAGTGLDLASLISSSVSGSSASSQSTRSSPMCGAEILERPDCSDEEISDPTRPSLRRIATVESFSAKSLSFDHADPDFSERLFSPQDPSASRKSAYKSSAASLSPLYFSPTPFPSQSPRQQEPLAPVKASYLGVPSSPCLPYPEVLAASSFISCTSTVVSSITMTHFLPGIFRIPLTTESHADILLEQGPDSLSSLSLDSQTVGTKLSSDTEAMITEESDKSPELQTADGHVAAKLCSFFVRPKRTWLPVHSHYYG